MIPPPPFDARAPAYGGFDPNAYSAMAARSEAQRRLRSAGFVTMAGGAALFLFGLLLAIGLFVLGAGEAAAALLVFGMFPGLLIIVAGAMMQRPGASAETWVWVAAAFAALSLLSFGSGILIGSILAFVGAAMARSALRTAPAYVPPAYTGPVGPSPGYYGAPPVWTSGPPAPPPFGGYEQAPSTYGYGGAAGGYAPASELPPYPPPPPVYAPPAPPPPPPPPELAPPSPERPASPAWTHGVVGEFLQMDAERGFSLESLNLIDFSKLRAEAGAGGAGATQADKVRSRAVELLRRIGQDIADINTIDDILRDRAVLWYRDSPDDPAWAQTRVLSWSGLVSESHTAGGARTPALADRLAALRDSLAPAGGSVKRGFLAFRKPLAGASDSPAARPSASLAAQVVQAILDDLAETPRTSGAPLSLLRLAEVAAKAAPAAVNRTLADLFKADARGPVVLLHPSRYPGFEFVIVRLPPPSAAGAAIAYEVVCAAPDAPAPGAIAVPAGAAGPTAASSLGIDVSPAVWASDEVDAAGWRQILAEVERRRERLSAPPSNFRKLPAYFTLRKLVLQDASARRMFLAVKWRGKPPGIGLVAELLEERSLVPEVDTDGEYLEAELSDIERGDAQWRPEDLRWAVAPGATAARAVEGGALVYRVV